MEAAEAGRRRGAEGGSGSSVDVLDGIIMCGSNFPLLPVQAYSRNSTEAEILIFSTGRGINPSEGGRNPQKKINRTGNCSK
jgi:hypothetical protein